MIFIDRNSVPIPDFFSSKEYKIKIAELERFYHSSDRAQKRFAFYIIPDTIIFDLMNLFNKKCAYCETNSNDIEYPFHYEINHFRPRNNAKDYKKNSLDYYWWLTYKWENMYFCCDECNNNKSNWFPIDGKRAKIESNYYEIIKMEKNLLVDPCNDNPDEHFDYNLITGEIISKSKRGKVTIQILNLNRKNLIKRRLIAIKEETDKLTELLESKHPFTELIEENRRQQWNEIFYGNSKKNYIAIRRKTIFIFLKNNNLIDFFIDIIPNFNYWNKIYKNELILKTIESKINILKNIQLEKIELKNYKCFDDLKINFNDTKSLNKEPWLVFLGENGVGKSSLLKAIAIGLMGQTNIDKQNFNPSKHLQYGKRVGYIKLFGKNGEFIKVRITKNKITSSIKEPSSYLIGYGSTRLLPKGNLLPETDVEYVKIKNLFDYSIALEDAKSWLLDVPTKMFDQVAISLKDLLLLDNEDTLRRNKNKNQLYIRYAKGNNNRTDVSDLSDGYKTIFAITVDIIKTLSKDNLAFETAEGTILIDEIGTHLHPRWKMEVVDRLRKTFPKLQFIATTHEPLCLRGLGENEVVVLKKDNNDEIIAITDLPNPNEFRVDQLLTSEYFGLNSTMDFETEDLFKEYYALIAKEDNELTNEDKKRRDELSELLPNKKHLGDDIRDELVYYVIDELLAKKVNDKGYKIIDEQIKEEALNKVKSIWEHISKNDNSL